MRQAILFFLLLITITTRAQLTGTKTIPGDYTSMAAAVADLNFNGVGTGGVTFNITAGYTETGNFTITATGTAANPIVFQKNGAGANPLFTAAIGTGWDAVFKMTGTDYTTFDGLSLEENPANAGGGWIEKTEFGFSFVKVDATNGCQHNTIKNCSISLDRTFYQVDGGGAAHFSCGVYMYNVNAGYVWINSESTTTGTHSYNIIQNNTISNIQQGVYIYGYHNTSSGLAVIERENEVKDNTINNLGGTGVCSGVGLYYAANCTITGNNITTHPSHTVGASVINYYPLGLSGCIISNNSIQMDGSAVLNPQKGIYVQGVGAANPADPGWNTITINNNTIQSSNTNYEYNGIESLNIIAAFQQIENNVINLNSNPAANSGEAHGIWMQNWWSHQTTVSIKNNIIRNHASSLTNATGISLSDNTDLVTIEGNRIYNNNANTGGAFQGFLGIYFTALNGSVAKNNLIDLGSTNTTFRFTGIKLASEGLETYNNLISCRATPVTGQASYVGIEVNAPAGIFPTKIHHNTVYLGGGSTGVNNGKALAINTTQPTQLNNNIFYTNMLPGNGTGKLVAFANLQSISNTNFLSKNNLFYCGTPSATNITYTDPQGDYQSLVDYKLHVCAKDVNSVSGTVPFLSFDFANANYLHIDPAIATLVNNNGTNTPEVTVDYDGQSRNVTTPDIGADELNGTNGQLNSMITMPVLWLKADADVYNDAGITFATNGQTVQQWNDQTCNGFNVSQSNSGWRPTWDQYAFNGKPAIKFDKNLGTKFLENLVDNPVAAGAERTIFIVAKSQCGYNGGTIFTQRRTAPYAAFYVYNIGSNPITLYSDGVNGASNANTTVSPTTNELLGNFPFIATYRVPTNNGFLQFYVNGVPQTVSQSAGVTNESGNNGFTLGTWDNLNDPLPWGGWIAEIIVYNKSLSDEERQAVETYLQNKYTVAGLPAVFNGLPAATTSSDANQSEVSWVHMYNTSNSSKVIASVNAFCLDLGTINSTVYNDATAGVYGGIRYMRRHYVINTTLNPFGGKLVRLYYTDADFADLQSYVPGLTSASQLVITKYSGANEDGVFDPSGGTTQLIPPSQITTGTVMGVNYLEFYVTGFSEFWIHTGMVALPLQFQSFTAQKCNNNQVCLNWKTANEQDVSHFEIEKSTDGSNFYRIGSEPARNQSQNLYSFLDNATTGADTKVYYRIRQVDADGRVAYSSILWVSFDEKEISIYPTVFENKFNLQNNQSKILQLDLYSADGKWLQTQAIKPGTNTIAVNTTQKGIIIYRIQQNGILVQSGKLWKQ